MERASLASPWTGEDPGALWDGQSDLGAQVAVRMALAASPEIAAAMERIAVSRADLVQSGLLPNPVLNVSLGFPIGGAGGATGISAGVVQNLAWLMQMPDREGAATHELEAEVLAASDHALALVAQVRSLHARIVLAQRAAVVRGDTVSQAERALDLARRSAAAGEGSSLEVNRRDLRLLEMRVEAAQAAADLGVMRREMLRLIGRPADSAEWAASAEGLPATVGAPAASEDEAVALAVMQRLDVAASAERAQAARVRAGLGRREIWSDVEAGVEYHRDEDKREELGPAVSVPIPIFDTGAARTARAAAEAGVAEQTARDARARAITEARSAYVRAASAAATLAEFFAEPVGPAERNLDLSRRAFTAGTLELTGLLEAEESEVRVRLRRIELEEAAVIGAIELERAVGGRLDRSALPAGR